MNRLCGAAVALGLTAVLTGCATMGSFPAAHLTTVELSEANFRVAGTDVGGEADAGYILGVSAGFPFSGMQTVAIARVEGEGDLYGAALRNLWRSFARERGPVGDRRLALANVRFDSEALNLIVYTRPRVWIHADAVEFEGWRAPERDGHRRARCHSARNTIRRPRPEGAAPETRSRRWNNRRCRV